MSAPFDVFRLCILTFLWIIVRSESRWGELIDSKETMINKLVEMQAELLLWRSINDELTHIFNGALSKQTDIWKDYVFL